MTTSLSVRSVESDARSSSAILLIGLVLFAWGRLGLPPGQFSNADIAGMAYNADLLNEGRLPYIDSIEGKAPGTFFLFALVFRIFGRSVDALWWVFGAWQLLGAVAVWWAARQLYGRSARLSCAVATAIYLSSAGQFDLNYSAWMTTAYAWAFAAAITGLVSGKRSWHLFAGLCVVAAFLLKRQAVVLAPLFPLLFVWARRRRLPGATRGTWDWWALGALAGAFPLAAFYAARGQLGELIPSIFPLGAVAHYAGVVDSPFSGTELLRLVLAQCFAAFPLAVSLCLANLVVAFSERRRSDEVAPSPPVAPQLALVLVSICAGSLGGPRYYIHYLIQYLPGLALLAARPGLVGYLFGREVTSLRRQSVRVAMVALLLFSAGWHGFEYATGRASRRDKANLEPARRAGEYIAAHTSEDDTIMVWGWHAWPTYFWADRRAPVVAYKSLGVLTDLNSNSVFFSSKPIHFRGGVHAEALMEAFVERPPAYFVYTSYFKKPLLEWREFMQMLRRDYFLEATFDHISVLAHRSRLATPSTQSDPTRDATLQDETRRRTGPDPGDYTAEFLEKARRSRTIDDFDNHRWVDAGHAGHRRGRVQYSSLRPTEGIGALRIRAPLEPVGQPDLPLNTVAIRLDAPLAQSQDWSHHRFLTFDIYMEQQPTTLAEVHLVLRNRAGKSERRGLILGWQLFQWENYQMTLPLQGNAHRWDPFDPEILGDVAQVELWFTRYDDGQFGPPLPEVTFHLDNLRLDGWIPWDDFDRWGRDWQAVTPRTRAAVTLDREAPARGGVLGVEWRQGRPSLAVADSGTFAGIDVGDSTSVTAWTRASVPGVSVSLDLFDGDRRVTTEPRPVESSTWQLVSWPLPPSIESITRARVVASSTTHGAGQLTLDDLRLESRTDPATAAGRPGRAEGDLAHADALDDVVPRAGPPSAVHLSGNGLAAELVPRETTACSHTSGCACGPRAVPAHAPTGQPPIVFAPGGATYEVGFDRRTGSMLYVYDAARGTVVSSGDRDGDLWRAVFMNETDLPGIRASDVGRGDGFRFEQTDELLTLYYDWRRGEQALSVDIEVSAAGPGAFDLKARVDNRTGSALRTLGLPPALSFDDRTVEHALLPILEGLVLLPPFFESDRSTHLTRPPLFADILAYEGADRSLAVFVVQDSRYQAELIPGHPPDEPVFQPTNLSIGSQGDTGYLGIDHVTYVPDGRVWTAPTVRFSVGADLRRAAAEYASANGFRDRDRYPTLAQKLDPFGLTEALSKSPIYTVEVFKMVEWLKSVEGEVWETLQHDWLPRLPTPSVLHLTHWQRGRGGHADPREDHKLEDGQPDSQPIWWERYGSEEAFHELLGAARERGFLLMPFTNWTVMNQLDPATRALPPVHRVSAAARALRGDPFPLLEYKGYLMKPWRDEVRARNDEIVELYRETYPQDLLFADQTGERSWRYMLMDDGTTASVAAYTQSVVNENVRLSKQIPLFTEGLFDRIANSVTGCHQSLTQKFWNDVLEHLGDEYHDWAPYPFAADVVHENVAFYPHNLNTETWPARSASRSTYYATYGYNMVADATAHFGEDEEWLQLVDAMQKAVSSRTFGQPLAGYEPLNERRTLVRTRWGDGTNDITILANFDPDRLGFTYEIADSDVAPNGFFARTENGDMVAGAFQGRFNGQHLTDGLHWISVLTTPNEIRVRHPYGSDTWIALDRPEGWTSTGSVTLWQQLTSGEEIPREELSIEAGRLSIGFENRAPDSRARTQAYVVRYDPDHAASSGGPSPSGD